MNLPTHPVPLGVIFYISISALLLSQQAQAQGEERVEIDLKTAAERVETVEALTKRSRNLKAEAVEMAKEKGWKVRGTKDDGTEYELIRVLGERPIYFETENSNAAISNGANEIRETAPYNLTGTGWIAGVWDGGLVRPTHQEFGNRVTNREISAITSSHGTHVAGTVAAAGIVNSAKGMAPNASIFSYDWSNDEAEMAAAGAATGGQAGKITVSNHSYGIPAGWEYDSTLGGYRWRGNWPDAEDDFFGQYSIFSRDWDAICYDLPYYLPFRSSGNERSENPANGSTVYYGDGTDPVVYDPNVHPKGDGVQEGGYDSIQGDKVGKNIVTVGAANDAVSGGQRSIANSTMTTFSSWGPADDGRVKPDIVANGTSLYSTDHDSDTDYSTKSGTSMSTPSATGAALLLQEHYFNVTGGEYMRASTLKALILGTADDLGNPGPDYVYGHGLMNAKAAADLISEDFSMPGNNIVTEGSLSSADSSDEYTIFSDGTKPLELTLVWTDPEGSPRFSLDDRSPTLINDLDIRVTVPGGGIALPFVLDPMNPTADATTGDNTVDNVERILIDPPQLGQYTVTISNKGTLVNDIGVAAPQFYSLVVSGTSDGDGLVVEEPDDFVSSGDTGGPFLPNSKDYTIRNVGDATLNWATNTSASWMRVVPDSGSLSPNGTAVVTVSLTSNAASLPQGDYFGAVTFTNTDTSVMRDRSAALKIRQVATVPFLDNFESGVLESYWEVTGTGTNVTRVTSDGTPHDGSYHALMASTANSSYSRNELTLSIDLLGESDVELSFWARDFTDEPNGPPPSPFTNGADFDGVAISADGETWYEVQPLRNEVSATYKRFAVDLDEAVSNHGLVYTSNFQIRFNQYDNFTHPSDGIAIDTVVVYASPPAPPPPDLSDTSDTGLSSNDNITSETQPTFTGSAGGNANVTLQSSIDGDIGSTSASGDGSWTIVASALSEGTHEIRFSATNQVQSEALTVKVDTSGPAPAVNQANGQSDPAPVGSILFTAEFGEPVTDFDANDVTVGGTVGGTRSVLGGPSNYTITIDANGGEGFLTASVPAGAATDLAGNPSLASVSSDNTVEVDGHGDELGEETLLSFSGGGTSQSSQGTGRLPAGDIDAFKFILTEAQLVEITSVSSFDIVGSLFDSTGAPLNDPLVDDNAGNNENFLIERLLPAGSYTVLINSNGTSSDWSYFLTVDISPPPVFINEVDRITFDDGSWEFIELFDGGSGDRSLDGLVVVLFDGSDDSVYAAFDLDGFTSRADGYFVLGSDDLSETDLAVADSLLRDGTGAVALYEADAVDFPNGTGVTTTELSDAVVYLADGQSNDPGLAPLLFPGESHLLESANGFEKGQSLQRMVELGDPRRTNDFVATAPTPGATNGLPPAPSSLDLPDSEDTGISTTDNITKLDQPSISGGARPGTLVEISSDQEGILGITETGPDGVFVLSNWTKSLRDTTHTISCETVSTGETGPSLAISVDTRRPIPTVNQATGQTDPTTVGPIKFDVEFDEEINDFGPEDITFLSGLTGPLTITGGPMNFEVSVGADTVEGFLEITVAEGGAFDDAGNATRIASHIDNAVTLDLHGATEEDATALSMQSGVGAISGWVQPGDSDWFLVTLTDPRKFLVSTTGGVDTIGRIMDMEGNVLNIPHLDDDEGSGDNFLINLPLEAGQYFVEVSGRGQSSGQYTLGIDATEPPFVQPDLAVGTNASNAIGDGVYDDVSTQSLSLHSYSASTASGTVTIQNDGEVTDDFTVSAPPGDAVFGVQYTTWRDGNITAELITGRYRVEDLAPGESAPPIVAVISPNYHAVRQVVSRKLSGSKLKKIKKKLKKDISKKKKKKLKSQAKKLKRQTITSIHWLRYAKTLTFRATSDIVEDQVDEVQMTIGTN